MTITPRVADAKEARLWDAIAGVCNDAQAKGEADVQAVVTVLLNLVIQIAHEVEGIPGVDQAIRIATSARDDLADLEAAKQRGLN